jgi:hypothetical protein
LFYLMMVGRAATWGEKVKGAFDLYRRPLLAQLAYQVVPKTLGEERALWIDISQQVVFGDSPRVRPAEFTGRAVAARGEPRHATLRSYWVRSGSSALDLFLLSLPGIVMGRVNSGVVISLCIGLVIWLLDGAAALLWIRRPIVGVGCSTVIIAFIVAIAFVTSFAAQPRPDWQRLERSK